MASISAKHVAQSLNDHLAAKVSEKIPNSFHLCCCPKKLKLLNLHNLLISSDATLLSFTPMELILFSSKQLIADVLYYLLPDRLYNSLEEGCFWIVFLRSTEPLTQDTLLCM